MTERKKQIIERALVFAEQAYDAEKSTSRYIGFLAGAEWADKNPSPERKEWLDKAVEWLEANLQDYWLQKVSDPTEFIEEFRKTMEE